ncbi:hypothetical protein R3P38DRAFT_2831037 [Favolaschia claudopus]|uniref:Actin cytoskeleton-regulatory complex protein SLA1 n=1 Tax=Favolaschia claudopus TaxID=2862362 RepID=A0AAW0EDZ3_9AGAR
MAELHYLAVLKATYDYDPEAGAEDEIPIKENQLLFLREKVDSDWWKVKIKGESQEEDTPEGLVPAAYVEPADHSKTVKALYDYEATAAGELTIKEDQVLLVFDTEEEWLLVQTDEDGGKAGFVPANYVEDASAEEDAPPSAGIVIPDSPPKPAYVDPAARVASTKIKADDIKTWSVSEVDKKGKKKKGTLGVGNGAVFFASESDKTPVQKWQTSHIININVEKSKHVHIDVGGPNPINLHFSVGSKDNADAIVSKLESSKELSAPSPSTSPPPESSTPSPPKAVHFAPESPTVIPDPDDEEEEQEEVEEQEEAAPPAAQDDGMATVLYDFTAAAADELSVSEGERLTVLEKDDTDEWWKCRNSKGKEGVVPASYLEGGSATAAHEEDEPEPEPEPEEEDNSAAEAEAAREAEERERAERAQRAEAARLAKEKAEKAKERAEKERKKLEAQKRAKAAEDAAEAERIKRKQHAEAAKERAAKQESPSPPPAPRSPPEPKKKEKSDGSRTSMDPAALPPADRVRTWHDRTGQFRVEAAFLGFNSGKLRLHKINGVIVEVPAEKMSAEDMKYLEKIANRKSRSATAQPAPKKPDDEDDLPLAQAKAMSLAHPQPKTKKATTDWFDFFLSAGCELDDCTRYAQSFERDKIDETILLDITDATMRSLGLREGDIIRVTKAIDKRRPAEKKPIDEGPTKSPPNLFTQAGGVLKAPRRGRPQPTKSLPSAVDMSAISAGSDDIPRTSSPQVLTPTTAAQAPPRSSSVSVPKPNGFDDDAWTNRPSSTQPPAATAVSPPPAVAPRAPSAPPMAAPVAAPAPAPVAPPVQPAQSPPSLAKTTESDVFEQLARLQALKSQNPSIMSTPTPPAISTPPVPVGSPPVGYISGLGMGSSPVPMGQHLNNQRTGLIPSPSPQPQLSAYAGPRGPLAPVPANQSLLAPLIPTQTGFNSFVPTRPGTAPTMMSSPFANPPMQPSFLSSQPTGYPGGPGPLQAQPTGFQPSFMAAQPTGAPFGGFNGNGFVQSNPTGFGQSPFGNNQSPFNNPAPFNNTNGFSSPPPVPPLPSSAPANTNPANIFAQMKAGTLGAEDDAPQSSDRYDALRPNPMVAQTTGWGGGYQGGYGGYH